MNLNENEIADSALVASAQPLPEDVSLAATASLEDSAGEPSDTSLARPADVGSYVKALRNLEEVMAHKAELQAQLAQLEKDEIHWKGEVDSLLPGLKLDELVARVVALEDENAKLKASLAQPLPLAADQLYRGNSEAQAVSVIAEKTIPPEFALDKFFADPANSDEKLRDQARLFFNAYHRAYDAAKAGNTADCDVTKGWTMHGHNLGRHDALYNLPCNAEKRFRFAFALIKNQFYRINRDSWVSRAKELGLEDVEEIFSDLSIVMAGKVPSEADVDKVLASNGRDDSQDGITSRELSADSVSEADSEHESE